MAGRFQRSDRNAAQRDRGKAVDLGQRRAHAVGVGGIFEPLEKMPALFFDVGRFDQGEPAFRRQIIGKVLAVVGAGRQRGHLDRIERVEAALAGDFEAADRFDRVAKKFDPHRLVPVGSEQVENAAAMRQFAGQLDGAGGVKSMLDQPGEQGRHVDLGPLGRAAAFARAPPPGVAPAAGWPGCW